MAADDSSPTATSISKQEQEVYDRQIRLWGMDAQNKLRNSSVLIVGLSGLGAEIVKNLMLCGLKSLTMMDEQKCTEDDKLGNFLLEDDYLGKNRAATSSTRAQSLNPMVDLSVIESGVSENGPETWSKYNLVILVDQLYQECERVDSECRAAGVGFMCSSVFGTTGYAFFDFNDHPFLVKQQKKQEATLEGDMDVDGTITTATLEEDTFEKEKLKYSEMKAAFNVEWAGKKYLRRATRLLPSSYFPIRAVLRAQVAGSLTGDEETDTQTVTALWKKELEHCGQSVERQTHQEEDIECLIGPQMSPVCAIVGGIVGQEAIKALSENECPLQNMFLYSAIDTTGIICNFPPQ